MYPSGGSSSNYVPEQVKKNQQYEVKKSSGPEQQLQELLTCHICLCLGRNLTMCPHCSKLYCQQCISQSLLIKQQCPHCRKYIKDIKSMANCDRFVNEIKGIVEDLLKQRNSQNFKCLQHDVILNYYCLQCQIPVCCECKMFGSHGEHEFVQVEKKYKEKYEELRQMLADLKVCINEKQQFITKLQQRLNSTQEHHQQEIKQIQKLQNTYHELYAKKAQNYQSNSKQNLIKLEQRLQNFNETKKQLKAEVTRRKNEGKFNLSKEYIQKLQKAIQLENESTQAIKKDLTSYNSYLSGLIPSYEMKMFVIDSFSQKRTQYKEVIYSEPMKMLGCEWRLKIHPNGSGSVEGKYLSIYVMMVSKSLKNIQSAIKDPTTYEYRIELIKQLSQLKVQNEDKTKQQINLDLNHTFVRQYTSSFQPGQSWGYTKYIELSQLYCEGFVDANRNDRLIVRFGIRRPDYFTEYQSLCRQLQAIEREIK